MTTCIVHFHGQGPYWRDDTGSAHEGERRAYCQRPAMPGFYVCSYHRDTAPTLQECRDCDEARIQAEQITRLTGG